MASSTSGSEQFPLLTPKERADAAAKRILAHLLTALEYNQAEFLHGTAGDYLHEFRVAMRRTRSALNQIKQVFPASHLQRFAAGFAALSQLSSAVRDWEVHLQSFDDQAQTLTEPLRQTLAPMQTLLAQRHTRELRKLKTHLHSAAHRRFLDDWRAFVDAPVTRHSNLTHAAQPVKKLADRRIWKIYWRVLAEGNGINPQSPPQALHELRKTCKKLRYLLEFFHSLYPTRQHIRLVGKLKALQDVLGLYQDCQVQAATLRGLATESALPTTLMTILQQQLEHQASLARTGFQHCFTRLASRKTRHRFAALLHGKD